MKLEILYEDTEMLVCVKPAGVPAQSDKSFDVDMVSAILDYRRQKGEDIYCAVINRLDKPVSGIMLFAKNKNMAARLSSLDYKKYYKAVVYGEFQEEKGQWTDYLLKDARNNMSKIVQKDTKGAKEASLIYEVKAKAEIQETPFSLVEILLLTGRHHQIRVQFSGKGHPLYGDRKYGNMPLFSRGDTVALCAYKLEFVHPKTEELLQFEIKPMNSIFSRFE